MRALQAIALIPLIALVAACGSSEAGAPAKQAQEPAAKARLSSLSDPDGKHGPAPARSNEVLAEADKAERGGSSGANSAQAPCSLVSRAQAAAIVDEKIAKPQEAKLGPTCIYRYGDQNKMVTLAVQTRPTKALAREIGKSDAIKVSRKSGFCGRRGQPTLYVPLSGTQVLSVTAPCETAKQFAAHALMKLNG